MNLLSKLLVFKLRTWESELYLIAVAGETPLIPDPYETRCVYVANSLVTTSP